MQNYNIIISTHLFFLSHILLVGQSIRLMRYNEYVHAAYRYCIHATTVFQRDKLLYQCILLMRYDEYVHTAYRYCIHATTVFQRDKLLYQRILLMRYNEYVHTAYRYCIHATTVFQRDKLLYQCILLMNYLNMFIQLTDTAYMLQQSFKETNYHINVSY